MKKIKYTLEEVRNYCLTQEYMLQWWKLPIQNYAIIILLFILHLCIRKSFGKLKIYYVGIVVAW